MRTVALRLAAAISLLAGCGREGGEDWIDTDDSIDARAGSLDPAVTRDEVARLLAPEAGASAAEYRASSPILRLLGVQTGDRPFATIADTSTWQTRNIRVGQLIGRNLRLSDVGDGWAAVTDSSGAVDTIEVGSEIRWRQIRHQFDDAAIYRGKGVWDVSAATLADVRRRYGVGATAETRGELFPGTWAVQLTQVKPGSVFDRLGFRAGDWLFQVDGQEITPEGLDGMADRFTLPQPQPQPVRVQMFRAGSPSALTFEVR